MEFSYNNASSTSTKVSLFFDKSYHSSILVYSENNITFSQAYDFAINLNKLQSILKIKIFIV